VQQPVQKQSHNLGLQDKLQRHRDTMVCRNKCAILGPIACRTACARCEERTTQLAAAQVPLLT
jgi:hypothetical protein